MESESPLYICHIIKRHRVIKITTVLIRINKLNDPNLQFHKYSGQTEIGEQVQWLSMHLTLQKIVYLFELKRFGGDN